MTSPHPDESSTEGGILLSLCVDQSSMQWQYDCFLLVLLPYQWFALSISGNYQKWTPTRGGYTIPSLPATEMYSYQERGTPFPPYQQQKCRSSFFMKHLLITMKLEVHNVDC